VVVVLPARGGMSVRMPVRVLPAPLPLPARRMVLPARRLPPLPIVSRMVGDCLLGMARVVPVLGLGLGLGLGHLAPLSVEMGGFLLPQPNVLLSLLPLPRVQILGPFLQVGPLAQVPPYLHFLRSTATVCDGFPRLLYAARGGAGCGRGLVNVGPTVRPSRRDRSDRAAGIEEARRVWLVLVLGHQGVHGRKPAKQIHGAERSSSSPISKRHQLVGMNIVEGAESASSASEHGVCTCPAKQPAHHAVHGAVVGAKDRIPLHV